MSKLPIEQRPSMDVIKQHIQDVSEDNQNLFVIDLQNDCGCPTEAYDFDKGNFVLVYLQNEIKIADIDDRLVVPIHNTKLTNQHIESIVDKACEFASDHPEVDIPYLKVPTIENSKYKFYFPEPDYFGVLSANIRGWGVFCCPKRIYRKEK